MNCVQCSFQIDENGLYYAIEDMGVEIVTVLEEGLGPLLDKDGVLCSQCFLCITKLLPTVLPDSDEDTLSAVSESADTDDFSAVPVTVTASALPVTNNARGRVKCQSSLSGKKCQSVPEGARKHVIAKAIAPRQSKTVSLRRESVDTEDASAVPATVTASALPVTNNARARVKCQSSLSGKRCRSVPDGAKKNVIAKTIAPRQSKTVSVFRESADTDDASALPATVTAITLPVTRNTKARVNRQSLLSGKRCHVVPDGAKKRVIVKVIAPRQSKTVSLSRESSDTDDASAVPTTVTAGAVPATVTASALLVTNNARARVNCQSSLSGKRCHLLPDGAKKRVIVKRIAPRQSKTVSLSRESSDTDDASAVPANVTAGAVPTTVTASALPVTNNARTRVNCQSSLSGKRCHSVSAGANKRVITKTIAPRQITTESDPLEIRKRIRLAPPSFFDSPMKKRPRKLPLNSNEKTIALNVYKLVERLMTTYPYRKDVEEQVAEVMGISVRTVANIIQEYNRTGRVRSPQPPRRTVVALADRLDEDALAKIRRTVQRFDAETLTLNKVLAALREEGGLPKFSRMTLYRILKKMNVQLKRSNRKNPD